MFNWIFAIYASWALFSFGVEMFLISIVTADIYVILLLKMLLTTVLFIISLIWYWRKNEFVTFKNIERSEGSRHTFKKAAILILATSLQWFINVSFLSSGYYSGKSGVSPGLSSIFWYISIIICFLMGRYLFAERQKAIQYVGCIITVGSMVLWARNI